MYREIFPEIIILVLVVGSLVFIPLYFNMHTVSLHMMGRDWDYEVCVLGASMYPTLKVNEFICVAKVNASSVRAAPGDGDILVFQRPNASLAKNPPLGAHRAIDKTVRNGLTYFETKGDNNDSPDQWDDSRGENYTWNGMFSELLLMGRVVGLRKTYAVEFPVAVMTIFLVCVIAADIVIFAFLMRRNVDSQATDSRGKRSEGAP